MTAPLLLLGYGSDNDAWRVARAADEMWETGRYVASRSTGFPLYETLVTPAVRFGGWYLSNALSLVFGLALIAGLFRLAGRGEFKHPVLVVISIAFLPIVIANASSTMDFIPSLAILIWAYVMLREEHWLLCGALIGIACGFRPTSGLFVVPVVVYLLKEKAGWTACIKTTALAVVVGVVVFSPALFGSGMQSPFGGVDRGLRTTILAGGYYGLQTLGVIQSLAVAAGLIWYFRRTVRHDRSYLGSAHFAFHLTVIVVWGLLFVAMPHESAYLLPAVPSLVFVIDRVFSRKTFVVLSMLLLSFHFVQLDVLAGESGRREIKLSIRNGATIDDIEDRRFRLSTRRAATNWQADRPTILLFGDTWIAVANDRWVYETGKAMYRRAGSDVYVSRPVLDERRLETLANDGYRLVVWTGAKWEYVRGGPQTWREYVEVVDDLSALFGTPIEGRWKSDRSPRS
jgi:hypothetical protein